MFHWSPRVEQVNNPNQQKITQLKKIEMQMIKIISALLMCIPLTILKKLLCAKKIKLKNAKNF